MFQRLILLGASILLAACEIPPDIQQLQNENATLEAQLASARQQISSLESERQILAADNTELKRVMSILDTEKASRTFESAELRSEVRKFTQTQIDQLKEFMVQSNLLDYVGEELFDRTKLEAEPGVLLDFANPIPGNGTLVGVTGVFSQPTAFAVNILRPVNDQFVVIWQSETIEIADTGAKRVRFPISVGVEKGDVVAYDFPVSVSVKYDLGTGDTLLAKRRFSLGETFNKGALKGGDEKRAYSLGVVAILD